jgi:hypothetical protein
MKSRMTCFVLTAAVLLASTQLARAQGTSGGNGAVASIPSSVVRGHEQGPGLISIITGSTAPSANSDRKRRTVRQSEADGASRQRAGK